MNSKILSSIVLGLVLILAGFVLALNFIGGPQMALNAPTLGSGNGEFNNYNKATNGSTTVTTASTLIFATNTARLFAQAVNDCSVDVYISKYEGARMGKGGKLAPNGSFILDTNDNFTGAVYGIASTTCNLTTSEK